MNSHPKGLSVITIPVKTKRYIEKVQLLKEVAQKKAQLKQIRQGDTTEGNLSYKGSFDSYIIAGGRKNNVICTRNYFYSYLQWKPIITCKNSRLNHYRGGSYGKFDVVSLASNGWKNRKSKGDFFTIHNHRQNPAFIDSEESRPTFEELGLDPRLVEQLQKNGYETPTNIQARAIPAILEGSSTIVSAETGNGKTLSFLAPIINKILVTKEHFKNMEPAFNSPQALIILPSRELVAQTRDMARPLCNPLGIRINSIFGGRTKQIMLHPKVTEHDIVIGSFGAISKLVTSRVYRKDRVNHIVLDEADTLLDDSFNQKMKYFLNRFPLKECLEGEAEEFTGAQLTLVGATFPRSMESILKDIVDVKSLQQVKTPYLHRLSPHITHSFYRIGSCDRVELLLKLAKKNLNRKIPTIIFSNTASCATFVSHFLNDNGLPCIDVHGSMSAQNRINRFQKFQDEEFDFISCTDLVSRGLNTVRAKHVINFDFPSFISDYIHRCGRTGRVGAEDGCHVTNFIHKPYEVDLAQKIEYAARKIVDLPNVNANIKRYINARVEKRMKVEAAAQEAVEDANEIDQNLRTSS